MSDAGHAGVAHPLGSGSPLAPIPPVRYRRLPFGALLETSLRLYLRTIGPMSVALLLIVVPGLLVYGVVAYEVVTHAQSWFRSNGPRVVVVFFVLETTFATISMLMFAVCTKIAANRMFGQSQLFPALGYVLARTHSLILILLLFWLVGLVATVPLAILGLIPIIGLLAALAIVVFVVWFAVSASLTVPSLVLSHRTGVGAIGRSFEIIKGAWFRCAGIYTVVFVLTVATSIALQYALGIGFETGLGIRFGGSSVVTAIPILHAADLVLALVSFAIPLVIYVPFLSIVSFLLFLDLTAATDRRWDAEEIAWRMDCAPSPDGLIFALADPGRWGPGLPVGPPAGPGASGWSPSTGPLPPFTGPAPGPPGPVADPSLDAPLPPFPWSGPAAGRVSHRSRRQDQPGMVSDVQVSGPGGPCPGPPAQQGAPGGPSAWLSPTSGEAPPVSDPGPPPGRLSSKYQHWPAGSGVARTRPCPLGLTFTETASPSV